MNPYRRFVHDLSVKRDIYSRRDALIADSLSSEITSLLSCIDRIEDLLDEEMRFLNQAEIDKLEPLNTRKSHLLAEFVRLSPGPSVEPSPEVSLRLQACHRKAEHNAAALQAYFSALEDFNKLILDHLRRDESAGTYSRREMARPLSL